MRNPFPHLSDEIFLHPRPGPYNRGTESSGDFPDELVPTLCFVNERDLARAPRISVQPGALVPPEGNAEEILATLTADRAAGAFLEYPSWPVCCRRPATLILIDAPFSATPEASSLIQSVPHYTEAEIRETWGMNEEQLDEALSALDAPPAEETSDSWRDRFRLRRGSWRQQYDRRRVDLAQRGTDGVALFTCRNCGRCYLGSHHVP